ncbi:MAG: hypothetical protein ACRENP_13655 [Longimicrobiales bacterium]
MRRARAILTGFPRSLSVLLIVVIVAVTTAQLQTETDVNILEATSCRDGRDAVQATSIMINVFGVPPLTMENEAHDCQRIHVNHWYDREHYGSLVSTWRTAAADVATWSNGVHVANLINFGKDEIDDLNMKRGFNCVLIKQEGTQWTAQIHPPQEVAPKCTWMEKGTTLPVWRVQQPYHKYAYPPAVRIHDGPERYYIGAQCGNGYWCIIGMSESQEERDAFHSPTNAFEDEQRLAVMKKNKLKPSTMWGTVKPDPELGTRDGSYFKDYAYVATLYFSWGTYEEWAHYAAKYGLTVAELKDGVTIELKFFSESGDYTKPDSARFRYDRKDATARKIEMRKMGADHLIKGSSRWRWSETDEGVWIFCPIGCCGDDSFGPPPANPPPTGSGQK